MWNNKTPVKLTGLIPLGQVDIDPIRNTHMYPVCVLLCSCSWKGEPCNINRDFVTTLTDTGVCYTFNSGENADPLLVMESGNDIDLPLYLDTMRLRQLAGY